MFVHSINSNNSFSSLWINHDARKVFDRALSDYCNNLKENVELFGHSSEEASVRTKTIEKFAEVKNAFTKSKVAHLNLYMDKNSNSNNIKGLIADIDFMDSKRKGYVLAGSVRGYDNIFDFIKGILSIAEKKKDSLQMDNVF